MRYLFLTVEVGWSFYSEYGTTNYDLRHKNQIEIEEGLYAVPGSNDSYSLGRLILAKTHPYFNCMMFRDFALTKWRRDRFPGGVWALDDCVYPMLKNALEAAGLPTS